jgi:hypothetical protein
MLYNARCDIILIFDSQGHPYYYHEINQDTGIDNTGFNAESADLISGLLSAITMFAYYTTFREHVMRVELEDHIITFFHKKVSLNYGEEIIRVLTENGPLTRQELVVFFPNFDWIMMNKLLRSGTIELIANKYQISSLGGLRIEGDSLEKERTLYLVLVGKKIFQGNPTTDAKVREVVHNIWFKFIDLYKEELDDIQVRGIPDSRIFDEYVESCFVDMNASIMANITARA